MKLQEEISYQLEILRQASITKAVLVEGKKDKLSLEYFKIENIITISKPLYKIVESIAEKYEECILLLDLDNEGNKLYKRLKDDLQKNGVKTDSNFRTFLFKRTGLKEIEGLKSFVNHINNNTQKIKA